MAFNFTELTRDDGYSTSSSAEDGDSTCVFQLHGADAGTPPAVEDIAAFVTYLCGGVDNVEPSAADHTDEQGGKVRRRLPKTHPFTPELSIAGCQRVVGVGTGVAGDSLTVLGLDPVTPQFWHYTDYNFTTQFKRRPYFLVPDIAVARPSTTYHKPDSTDVTVYYAEEWKRFTATKLTPTPETVNATTGGQMRFRSTGPLDGAQFPGQVWVYLQNQVLEMDWFMVPYRYFYKNSVYKPYLTRFVNTVNQNAMLGFDPGQLLFLGATPTPFLPQSTNILKLLGIGLLQSQSLLCNVKMRWLATTRESADAPAAGTSGLANLNNIPAGHNLQPSFTDRKFHYVTTEDPTDPTNTTKWNASFPSFPHELLFTDPMLIQPGGVV